MSWSKKKVKKESEGFKYMTDEDIKEIIEKKKSGK